MVIWWHPYVYAEILAAKISHVLYVKVSNDPEAKKIQADTDLHQTGGMCLRINQFKTFVNNRFFCCRLWLGLQAHL